MGSITRELALKERTDSHQDWINGHVAKRNAAILSYLAANDNPETVHTASTIANRAAELVGGDRDRQHGQKEDNFRRIAEVWNAYLSIRREPGAALDAVDVGHMMALMKIARTQSGALNVDDYVDGVGYIACAGEIAVRKAA